MWNTETEKPLIIFVSQMPAIYDSRPPKLKGKQLIEKKWIEISQLMNSTFSDLEFTGRPRQVLLSTESTTLWLLLFHAKVN